MAFDYENIKGVELGVLDRPTEPVSDKDYGFGDLMLDGIKATYPFVQSIKHPMHGSDEAYDSDFDREAWYRDVYPTLPANTQAAIDEMGGARSQSFVDIISARQQDEQDIQERMYLYGGLPASIGAQMVGSLLNPVDWAIAGATFGAGKAVTTANMVRNITNKYRKASSVALGAIEGTVGGYVSELARQETGGIYDEDARYDVALFGTVLGGSLGASGWVKFLNSQDAKTSHNILGAMDVDTKHTRSFMEAQAQTKFKPIGSGTMNWSADKWDIDDFSEIPVSMKPVQFMSNLSPKGRAYNRQIPTYRKILEYLVNPDVALQNKDGSYHIQSTRTADDIKTVDYDGLKGTLANEIAGSYHSFNASRVENSLPKMSEKDYGEYIYSHRIEANKAHREVQAEIDYLSTQKDSEGNPIDNKAKIAELEGLTPGSVIDDVNIQKANDAIDNYYGEMENKRTQFQRERRITELEDIDGELNTKQQGELDELRSYTTTPSRSYTTRIMNKPEFRFDSTTKNTVLAALTNSPTAKAITKHGSREEIDTFMDEMRDIAESMVEKIRTAENIQTLDDLMPTKGGAKGDLEGGRFSTRRRIDIDENLMGNLLQRDMTGIIDFYHRDTSGRLAIRTAFDNDGIDNWEDFYDVYGKDLAKEYDIGGYTPTQINNANQDLKRVFDTIRGTADIVSNPDNWFNQTKNAATAIQNIRFGLGFGMTSLTELGPAMAIGGIKTLRYMNPGFKAAMRKITNKDVGIEFIQELQGMGIGIDLQNSKVIERYVEGRADFESNKIINVLRQGENAAFRYGGLTVVTDMMKSMVGGAYTSRIYNIGRKLSDDSYNLSAHEEAMFARHGLTKADLIEVSQAPISFNRDGLLESFNFEDWDADLALKVKTAITRAVKGNILEPSAMDLPWNTKDPLHALLFQYLRFPVAATPKLLQRAIAEKDAGAAMGAMVSTLVVAGNTYIATQVAGKVGDVLGITDSDAYNDIFTDEEQQKSLAKEVWNKNPYLGAIPTVVNSALAVAGQPALGTEYRQGIAGLAGPSINYGSQVARSLAEIATEPGTMTSNQAHTIKTSIPIFRLPFFKELSGDYLEDNY